MLYLLRLTALFIVLAFSNGEPHRHRHARRSKVEQPSNSYVVHKSDDEIRHFLPVENVDDVEYEIIEHEEYDELKVVEKKCKSLLCSVGKRCLVDSSGQEKCVCAEPGWCAPGHKIVCGSDGNLYESHCELHRTACEHGRNLFVDKKGEACFQRDLLRQQVAGSLGTETHVPSKKKDLSQGFVPVESLDSTSSTPANDGTRAGYGRQCSQSQFEEFKHLLKIYHCNRLGMAKCDNQADSTKRALISEIYSYYDRDGDGLLTIRELAYSQSVDHLEKLAHICSLTDFIVYSSFSQGKDYLDLAAFYAQFGVVAENLSDIKTVEYVGEKKVTYMTADGYSGVEITCELPNAAEISWKRNGVNIDLQNTDGITLLTNRILYITAVNLDHTGNYTCYDTNQPQIGNSQYLIIQVKPVVRSSEVGSILEGITTSLKCHTDGVPQPSTEWQIFQYKLPDDKKRYRILNENTTLEIMDPQIDLDSAEYECVAKSSTGWSEARTDVQVLSMDQYVKDVEKPDKGLYMVFHGNGYTTYEAEHCYTTHYVDKHATDFLHNLKDKTSTLDRLCPPVEDCDWGVAVNVRNNLIYVSQPSLNRILIIDALENFRPKHVIILEHKISLMRYLDNTDELWVLAGNQPQFQTVMVLSDASKIGRLELKPLLPQHSIFDSVEEIFLPRLTSFNTTSRYGYALHYNQQWLSRLDITALMYRGRLDLSGTKCQPVGIHYLAIGGTAIVECDPQLADANLVIDTVSNEIINEFAAGQVYVSPNSRYVIAVTGPDVIAVYHLYDNATISFLYRHKVQINIVDVRFMESKRSAGYDLAITSPDENSILFIDLKTKKTEILEGFLSGRKNTTPSDSVSKLMAIGGEFGEDILVPSRGAVFIINKQYNSIVCQWTRIVKHQFTLWVGV